ncbi:Nuclear receptor coactivator 2 [Holothuria leucospilota]|uniref:Nuclear receptor coactivator 2 n=1 Tax=Holothuria leucospilota TaxID=206669 RepID=A0A9Q0YDN6_HOLLE|nr:Nuclear receptor coactivator 2 [Holothuria leucospilota]
MNDKIFCYSLICSTEVEQQGSEVQHSQVSSSKPGMLSGDSLESVLLQTLDGFLFVVNMSNNKAEIEYVSGNIHSYLNYKQEDLIGQSIYNFIHVGDHNHFISCLVPNSSTSGGMWKNDLGNTGSVSRSFNCRMQIKCDDTNGMNEETRYENMKCSAMLKPATDKDGESSSSAEGEGTSHLYVIAQRSSDDDRGGNHLQQPVEELKMELDNNCCILSVDTSKVKPPCYSKEEMISHTIYKFCHSTDRTEMRKYFDEVKEKGSGSSQLYSFQVYQDVWVYVQMTSQLRKNNHNGQSEIVVVHSIIRDPELSNRLKMSQGTNQCSNTSRVLEALTNMSSSPHINSAAVNQFTKLVMQRNKQQQHKQQQQQQQQQQQHGLGYGANNMNVHPKDRHAPMHSGALMHAGTPPLPDRTSFQGVNTFGQVPNTTDSNSVNPTVGAPMPNLEPSALTHIPSSSGPGRAGNELDDNDVFLPSKSQKPGDNPSPDTNDETDKDFLRRNILLSKLLQDDDTNRLHQVSDVNPKKNEQKEREKATSQSTLLASNVWMGIPQRCFGSGKLPKEQPGFISSPFVSTTTVLRKVSESGDEKDKKKNQMLKKNNDKSEGSPNKDTTTSPTVQQLQKPPPLQQPGPTSPVCWMKIPTSSPMKRATLSIQQIIQAANNFPDDLGANTPNLIHGYLERF